MALIKDYFEKTQQYLQEYGEKTVVLMQVGAFYEVYGLENKETHSITGSAILDFSSICDLNIADKKICVGTQGVLMAGFSTYMIDKYLKKLQKAGYTAVVYTQDEQAKNTSRSLQGIYSPGTYFSHDSSAQITNNICCIWTHVVKKDIHIGLANVDIYTGKSSIFEYKEQYILNPTTFDELERFLSIYNPSETIIIGNLGAKDLDTILHYGNIQSAAVHKIPLPELDDDIDDNETRLKKSAYNAEKQKYQKELLIRFYGSSIDIDIFFQNFYENTIATQAFCFLLDFIYQHNPNLVYKIAEPIFENCGDRFILANHSLKQLNIIDDQQSSGPYSSVEKLLNVCITSMGKRAFSHQLVNPSTNIIDLQKEYDMTEHILQDYVSYETLLKYRLTGIKDIAKITRQIMMKKIAPKMMSQLYRDIHTAKDIFTQLNPTMYTYLEKETRMDCIPTDCQEILNFIDLHFDMPLCNDCDTMSQFDINFIKRGIHPELDEKIELLEESTEKLEAIRIYLNNLVTKCEKKTKKSTTEDGYIKIHETEKNNFTLITTKRRCSNLKELLKKESKETTLFYGDNRSFVFLLDSLDYVTSTASNDSITSPQINQLCKNISSMKINMKDVITEVYITILTKMETFQEQLNKIVRFITIIDVLFAKASLAKKFNYCKPTVVSNNNGSFVKVQHLRHALIEHIQQNEIYISNSVSLDEERKGILLYGTNAVGKTCFIRALGIAVIMAQVGLYVPCSEFHFFPYKTMFTRILGNDNIFKGLSTFAVEMSELRIILRLANESSLILGDELCSGTESISAISIFVAGIQQLAERKSSFIFATHLHEIIHYEEINSLKNVSLNHMSVVYNKELDTLVYNRKLLDGPGENMYGLEVCKALHLPDDFLDQAHQIRMKYFKASANPLSLKSSHFNSQKVVGLCQMCNKEMGTEVHHLEHQASANKFGIITDDNGNVFHKNHPANLLTVCEHCHNQFHKKDESVKKKVKRVKTTKGTLVI
jgi:DNA mismatch repair protein MutS